MGPPQAPWCVYQLLVLVSAFGLRGFPAEFMAWDLGMTSKVERSRFKSATVSYSGPQGHCHKNKKSEA